MDPNDIKLSSVNWEHGMLLTPEHFLRQERYFDSAVLWAIRYCTSGFGLVGGGPRLPESERGAVRHDPVVTLDQDDEAVTISVTQCRGLTPGGSIIDIDPEHPLHRRFPKTELEGVAETGVYIVCDPQEKVVIDGPVDEFNPQMKTERRPGYAIKLRVNAEDAPYSIAVARLRRPEYGSGYEKDAKYIPPCLSLVSFSELTAGWRKILDSAMSLADRYAALHRAMREYLALFTERGIETDLDRETMDFVGRMVAALENCIYECLDPVQPPERFFTRLHQFFHSSAVYLDLSPPVKQYYDQMIETGETEFIALLEQQKQVLQVRRRWEIHQDLGAEVRAALESIGTLERLERALEGKYVDFRISPSLEGMNFVFDRGGKVLYKLAAKPARVQGFADELTLFFAQLRLEGREKYRLILVGEQNKTFEPGVKITAEIKINEGAGFKRQPVMVSCESKSVEQRNFEFDFEAPDVPTITDLRVSVPAYHPIRTALLFVRHRFYAGRQDQAPAPAAARPVIEQAARPAVEVQRVRVPTEDLLGPPRGPEPPAPPSRETPRYPDRDRFSEPPRRGESLPPWEAPPRSDRPRGPGSDEPPPPPRRRRLE
jgi:hypothetical protein